jgi:integrase
VVKKSDIISLEKINEIIRLAKRPKDRLLIKTLFYTGARISEIVGSDLEPEEERDPLIPKRIVTEHNMIILRNLKSKKFKKICKKCETRLQRGQNTCFCGSQEIDIIRLPKRWKEVNVPKEIIEEIQQYITMNRIQLEEPVFRMHRSTGYRIIRESCERAGVYLVGDKFPHPHNFRHSFVATGLKITGDLKYVQNQTGHKSLASIGEYIPLLQEESEQTKKIFDATNISKPKNDMIVREGLVNNDEEKHEGESAHQDDTREKILVHEQESQRQEEPSVDLSRESGRIIGEDSDVAKEETEKKKPFPPKINTDTEEQ